MHPQPVVNRPTRMNNRGKNDNIHRIADAALDQKSADRIGDESRYQRDRSNQGGKDIPHDARVVAEIFEKKRIGCQVQHDADDDDDGQQGGQNFKKQ